MKSQPQSKSKSKSKSKSPISIKSLEKKKAFLDARRKEIIRALISANEKRKKKRNKKIKNSDSGSDSGRDNCDVIDKSNENLKSLINENENEKEKPRKTNAQVKHLLDENIKDFVFSQNENFLAVVNAKHLILFQNIRNNWKSIYKCEISQDNSINYLEFSKDCTYLFHCNISQKILSIIHMNSLTPIFIKIELELASKFLVQVISEFSLLIIDKSSRSIYIVITTTAWKTWFIKRKDLKHNISRIKINSNLLICFGEREISSLSIDDDFKILNTWKIDFEIYEISNFIELEKGIILVVAGQYSICLIALMETEKNVFILEKYNDDESMDVDMHSLKFINIRFDDNIIIGAFENRIYFWNLTSGKNIKRLYCENSIKSIKMKKKNKGFVINTNKGLFI